MKNITLSLLFGLLSTIFLTAQHEIELIRVGYRSIGKASLESKDHNALNDVSSAHNFYTFSFNYGHSLRDTSISTLYSISYENISQVLDLSKVNQDAEWATLPENYYKQPSFSQLSISLGLSKSFRKDWTLSGLLMVNTVDDFFKTALPTNINLGGMAYVNKAHNKRFSYGAGLLFLQLERKLLAAPVVSLSYQNEKRGVEALIPAKLLFWQRINKVSYLEGSIYANFYSIEYQPGNEVISTDIFSFKPDLSYNYLWGNFLKLSIGLDLPLRDVTIIARDEIFNYQQNSLGFNISLSLVIST